MKRKLLILSANQFGYLTDTLKYCEFSADDFVITYICWDYNRPKFQLPGVTVKYVSRSQSIMLRNLRLLLAFHGEIRKGYDIVFANYTRGISIVKILNYHTNFIVDIRTLCVDPGKLKRVCYNLILKLETCFFRNVSIISFGLANKLMLRNFYVLPLGGDCFTLKSKSFERLSFLYVGTLHNRNILDCVKGFHLYLTGLSSINPLPIFTIVGNSPGNELAEINDYIAANSLGGNIIVTGFVPHFKLKPYFENANIGISYVPIRSYFEYQPPTKTFEYLISGLPVIATSTFANRSILKEGCGILIEDNAESFCEGLVKIEKRRSLFNSDQIKELYSEFIWHNLVKFKFSGLIRSLDN